MVVSAGLISGSFYGQHDLGEWDVAGVGLPPDSDLSHQRGPGDVQRGRIYPLMYSQAEGSGMGVMS